MTRIHLALSAIVAVLVSSCGGSPMQVSDMAAADLVFFQSAESARPDSGEYRIGVGDKLSIRVFQVEDLSFDEITVDTSGDVQMALVGAVPARDRTAGEVSRDIAARLAVRYLRNPQVTVTVIQAANQKITVDGAVSKPGVYEMRGSTSLLQAVAMAEGPTRIADLSQVAVFRTIDGSRSVAVFDLVAIRQGRASDPQVFGDDVIVVDSSRLNSALREILSAVPALAIFRPF